MSHSLKEMDALSRLLGGNPADTTNVLKSSLARQDGVEVKPLEDLADAKGTAVIIGSDTDDPIGNVARSFNLYSALDSQEPGRKQYFLLDVSGVPQAIRDVRKNLDSCAYRGRALPLIVVGSGLLNEDVDVMQGPLSVGQVQFQHNYAIAPDRQSAIAYINAGHRPRFT